MANVTRVERFNHFLFAPANGRVVGWFRVALALMLGLTFRPHDFELAREFAGISWLPHLYEQVFLTASYCLWLAALLVLFACGWRTRMIGFLLFVFLLPLDLLANFQQSRQIMLFVLAAFSLLPGDTSRPMPLWPIRLMQIQLTLVYGINAVAKSTPHFLSGDALIGMSQTLPNFQIEFINGMWHWWFLAIPVWLLAMVTVITEYGLALGFWFPRARPVMAVLGVGFHVALKFIIKIGMLDWVSMFLYLAFLLPFEDKNPVASTANEKVSVLE